MPRFLLAALCLLAASTLPAAVIHTPDAPGTVFFAGSPHVFTADQAAPNTACTVLDWQGHAIANAAWTAAHSLTLPPLPPGYYRLHCPELTAADTTFAVIPTPAQPPYDANSFFAFDAAFSWGARPEGIKTRWHHGDSYRLTADLLQWSGVSVVRERLRWITVNRRPGEFDFNRNRYLQNADLLQQHGLKISGMFHDVPAYGDKTKRFLRDLKLQYEICAKAAETFGDRMLDWEFWNEQDNIFSVEPVWDYVACLKAAYLGFKTARPDMIVAPGAICLARRNDYDRVMYENDAALYSDLLNMHTYVPLADYPALFQDLHAFMEEAGLSDRAIWMTEWNSFLTGPCAGPEEIITGRHEHSYEQELVVAETYVKGMTMQWLNGVSKSFLFIFVPFKTKDDRNNSSVMRRDGSVKAVYVAAATMASQLKSATLLGELAVGPEAKAFLFEQPDHSQTVLYWAVSPLETSMKAPKPTAVPSVDITLPLPAGNYTRTDLFGGTAALQAAQPRTTLSAERFPAYLSGLHGLRPDRPAHPQGTIRRQPFPADIDPAVIYHVDLPSPDVTVTNRKSLAELNNDTPRLTLVIWNLSDTAKQGRLAISGGTLSGLPDTITLPPMGKASFETEFHPDATAKQFAGKLVITGTFNGKATTKFVMPYKRVTKLFASQLFKTLPLDTANPQNWRRFDSATQTTITYDEAEQAIRLDGSWKSPDIDRWFYPRFTLNLPADTLRRARYICFDIKTSQDKIDNDFIYNLVSFQPTHAPKQLNSYRFDYLPPTKEWETRRVDLTQRPDLDWSVVRFMTLGGNPRGQSLSIWLRNVHFLLADEP